GVGRGRGCQRHRVRSEQGGVARLLLHPERRVVRAQETQRVAAAPELRAEDPGSHHVPTSALAVPDASVLALRLRVSGMGVWLQRTWAGALENRGALPAVVPQ